MQEGPDSTEPSNPYASTTMLPHPQSAVLVEDRKFKFARSVIVWTAVCSISAAPSFLIGLGFADLNWPWMVLGVLIFIAGYVAADRLSFDWVFRRRAAVRLSLVVTFVIRVVASVVFPVALFVDMFCGMASSQVIIALGHEPKGSGGLPGPIVLIWTLSQGVVMNALLSIIWVLLLCICWFVTKESIDEIPD